MPSTLKPAPPTIWWKKNKPITSWSSKPINPSSSTNWPNWPARRKALFFPPHITLDQGHGRHETREVYPFEVTPEQCGFPYAVQAALIVRTTHHLKELRVSEEVEIVISSRPAAQLTAAQIQDRRRGHWGIESVHYVRDVTLGEDASTVRTGHGPQNLAALRNVVIGLCALDAARQHKTVSYLPRFRSAARNNRSLAIDLVSRPLLDKT
jgi:hypothetical protein